MKSYKILALLFLITSCVSVFKIDNNYDELNVREFIIKHLKSNHKNFLDKTDVVIITISNRINNNEFVYDIYDKTSVQDIEVRPDSIGFSFRDYNEIENKLFVWESDSVIKKPSEIYRMFDKYNVRLDSCSYKYRYLTDDISKYAICSDKRESFFGSGNFSSIYLKVKFDNKKNKLFLKTLGSNGRLR